MSAINKAQEIIDADEQKIISEMKSIIQKSLTKDYHGKKPQRRFHAKSTGLISGRFIIYSNLPTHLQQGVFVPGKQYDCYVRFSNGASSYNADHKRGIRGMAIKLLDVTGTPIIKDLLGSTQDFVLTNNPILFPGTLRGQHIAIKTLFKSWTAVFGLLRIKHLAGCFTFIRSQVSINNPLNLNYFSGTPYLLGAGQAVKWFIKPLRPSSFINTSGPDYLRENINNQLQESDFVFQFGLQVQSETESIENSAHRWQSDIIPVATLLLPKQDINTPTLTTLDKQINFNPWHTIPQHRPLGGPNRFRKEYSAFMADRMKHDEDS